MCDSLGTRLGSMAAAAHHASLSQRLRAFTYTVRMCDSLGTRLGNMAAAAHPSPSVSPLPPVEQSQRNGVPEAMGKDKSLTGGPVAPVPVPVVVPKRSQNLEAHYNELLKIIAEIGKDVKPAYTNSKVSTDRLRKNITTARNVLKECMGDLEKLYGPSLHERNY